MAVYPFNLVGQLTFRSGPDDYLASGTIIGVKSVLTAGHNLYDPDTGYSTNLEFSQKLYGANTVVPKLAKRRYIFARYQNYAWSYGADSVFSFSRDSAGLVFSTALSGRQRALYSTDRTLLGPYHYQLAIGYGAEGNHTGDYPLFVHPTTPFYDVYGSFFENTSIYIEGGMSGGPLLTWQNGVYTLVGINVSGSTRPVAGGVRLLDAALQSNIITYLP